MRLLSTWLRECRGRSMLGFLMIGLYAIIDTSISDLGGDLYLQGAGITL